MTTGQTSPPTCTGRLWSTNHASFSSQTHTHTSTRSYTPWWNEHTTTIKLHRVRSRYCTCDHNAHEASTVHRSQYRVSVAESACIHSLKVQNRRGWLLLITTTNFAGGPELQGVQAGTELQSYSDSVTSVWGTLSVPADRVECGLRG